MELDLDKLLAPSPSITLTDVDTATSPKTFEEWCEVHGEPEYIGEPTLPRTKNILIEDCTEQEEEPIDTSDIITEDKKGNPRLDYLKFINVFAKINNLVYSNGVFYNPEGAISNQTIRRDITQSLAELGWKGRLDTHTNSIFTSLKDMYSVDELSVDHNVIPLANGDLHIGKGDWVFKHGEKKHSPYRLSVNYTPIEEPTPLFDKWLNDVFAPEDIPTVQEIMGYMLVPVTAVGEAFFIVGDGGAGKSGLGTILMGILGNASLTMETQTLVTKQFQIAEIENKLMAYDDDLGSGALTETGLLKKVITADTPIMADRKYADPHHFNSFCRILASANFMLSSLYDDSDGFYRRLHPILVKPKQPDRKVINKFYELILSQEKEQIFKWALVGLRRLMNNGWKITWSERSRNYLQTTKTNAVHFEEFFKETCIVDEDSDITTAELSKLYKRWCTENGIKEASDRRLSNWFVDNAEKIGLDRCRDIYRSDKRVRGYKGAKIRKEWQIGLTNTIKL